jgi:iron complex outermembrane receptor protein
MLKYIYIVIFCFLSITSIAQDYISNDTINLNQIEVQEVRRHKYGVGTIIYKIDSLAIEKFNNGNLADILKGSIPVYIRKKSDGFSSISLRGTAAGHTAILVEGINLNSLSLGSSNLGTVDMFLFDAVDLQLGSAGSIYGSDAIGGTVNLKLNKNFTRGTKVIIKKDYSSLKNNFNGIKIFHGNDKFESKTRLFYVNNKNEFKFKNLQSYDYEKKKYYSEYTNNSRKENYGLLQQFIYRPSLENSFSSIIWYQKNWYQIQPLMSDNRNKETYKKSLNEFIRILTEYTRLGESYKLKTNIGYIKDKQIPNGNKKELISTQRLVSNTSYEYQFNYSTSIHVGLNYKYIKPEVYTYPEDLDEHRTELFALFQQKIFDKLKYSLNIRQTFVSNYKSPFTPAIGLAYDLNNKKRNKTVLSINFSKGYKIPTFNQRYWGDLGNANINPEESRSAELGINISQSISTSMLYITLNGYYNDVSNWIRWINEGGEPRAVNESKVECMGGEFISHYKVNINELIINYRLNYFFTSSLLKESITRKENIGKQLAYTPRHNANTSLELKLNKYSLRTNYSYTGERHNSDYSGMLDAYTLCDMSFTKEFRIHNNFINLQFSVNNLFNSEYQDWEYYAVPGRNYNMSLNIKLN